MKADRRWWNDGRLDALCRRATRGEHHAPCPNCGAHADHFIVDPYQLDAPDGEKLCVACHQIRCQRWPTPCDRVAREMVELARTKWWHFNSLRLTSHGIEVITEDQGGHPFVGLRIELVDSDENVRVACLTVLHELAARPT